MLNRSVVAEVFSVAAEETDQTVTLAVHYTNGAANMWVWDWTEDLDWYARISNLSGAVFSVERISPNDVKSKIANSPILTLTDRTGNSMVKFVEIHTSRDATVIRIR